MTPIENYHGNPEEDVVLGSKRKGPKIYKNTPEIIPDPDTVSEIPGVDFKDWREELENKNEVLDTVEEGFDYVGNPDDDHLLAVEREELMKKYDTSSQGAQDFEIATEPTEASSDLSDSKKHESISRVNKPQIYKDSPKDNLKTMPETKKQRTFRDRIRKFLDFS